MLPIPPIIREPGFTPLNIGLKTLGWQKGHWFFLPRKETCLHCRAASPDLAVSRWDPSLDCGVDEFGWLGPRKWAQKRAKKVGWNNSNLYGEVFESDIKHIVTDTIIYKDAIDMSDYDLQKFILLHMKKLIFNEIVKIDFDLMILLIRISHI